VTLALFINVLIIIIIIIITHARWSIFTFPGQNEPCPGHGSRGSIPGQSRPFRDGWQA